MACPPAFRLLAAGLAGIAAIAAVGGATAATCEARSGPRATTVVELYTSEGCSSCPPADRWLSSLRPGGEVLALAFHVSYWDRLGWADRFAQPAFTERQRALMAGSGARQVYTPQVIAQGQDWRQWPQLPGPTASTVDLQLSREGDTVTALVQRRSGAGALAGYWALLEDGHRSDVRAGENAGATLRHDHVVRQLQPVPAWSSLAAQRLQWSVPAADSRSGGIGRRIAFVVVEPGTQRPLQALALAC